MNTAICIDSLLLRDDSTFLLELILNIYPNSEIYTIVHKQGSILGQVETRPIVSSYLTHKVGKGNVLLKNFWILPSAVKGIPLHPSINKVIVLSRGYIHGMNLPAHVEKELYIVEWDSLDQARTGWQKIFAPYVNDWREKALREFPRIAVSSEALKAKLELPNAEVIAPTYRTEEYPFVRDEDHNFSFEHHLVYTHDLSETDFRTIVKVLLSHNETVRVMGPFEHLLKVKEEFPQIDFAGDHCEATSAMYSHQAKAIWDFSRGFFPSRGFGALATGRPVVVTDTNVNREYLKEGAWFLKSFTIDEIENLYQTVNHSYLSFDRKVLRRLGLKWNERLFKSRMVKFLGRNRDLHQPE
jgi:glycosyltransferase involved in cell wall biosynthesis